MKAEGVGEAPEFFPTPSCPYYSAPLGSLSPYGDDAAALLDFASKQDIKGPALTKVGGCGAWNGAERGSQPAPPDRAAPASRTQCPLLHCCST